MVPRVTRIAIPAPSASATRIALTRGDPPPPDAGEEKDEVEREATRLEDIGVGFPAA
jgi:hypothetical protein